MLNNRYALTVSLDGLIELNTLYEGYDTLVGQFVWVKFIKPTKYMSKTFISDFIDERTVIDNLECPYLLKVLDVGVVEIKGDKLLYIVSEYSKGILLSDIIKGKYIHIEGVVSIATQIVKCLSMLHSNNMYHGSLNPSNILVDSDYNIKLLECGTTKANGGVNIRDNVGKYYLSPSQININYTDYESDFYVLGAILFKAIFNKLPYEDSDDASEMLKSMDKGINWPMVTSHYLRSNSSLLEIVNRLLSRVEKYKSAEDILVDLSSVLYVNANIEQDGNDLSEECSLLSIGYFETKLLQ